jgi:hypothetical protein
MQRINYMAYFSENNEPEAVKQAVYAWETWALMKVISLYRIINIIP